MSKLNPSAVGTSFPILRDFVGREHELARLTESLTAALQGRGSITVLSGEAGIGKTRTAEEFAACAGENGIRVLWGRCYEGEETPPYGPWAAVLRRYIRQTDATTLAVQAGPEAADMSEIVHELGEKLGGLEPPRALPPAEGRIRLFDGLIGFLKAIADSGPLVLIIDNLHCADPSSLQFLEHLANEMQESAIAIVATTRDAQPGRPFYETLGELVKHQMFRRIRLSGLCREDVRRYMAQSVERVPPVEMVDSVFHWTDGNPLFLVEIVRDLADGFDVTGEKLAVPEGVRQAISRRLLRLPERCGPVLSVASVIGRTFGLELLAGVLGEAEQDVLQTLDHARAATLIEEAEDRTGSYRFIHVLVQVTLLEGQSAVTRARHHSSIARVMEAIHGSDPGIHAGELLRHLAAAGERWERLVHFTNLAAEHALSHHAPEEALALLDRTLEVPTSKEGPEMESIAAALHHLRGRALDMMMDVDAEASLHRAFDTYVRSGQVERAVEVALTPTVSVMRVGPLKSLHWARSGSRVLRERALTLVQPGSLEEGRLLSQRPDRASMEKAAVIATSHGDETLEMWILARLVVRHCNIGDFAVSAAEESRAAALAERLRDTEAAFHCNYWGWYRSMLVGDGEGARTRLRANLEIARRVRSRVMLAKALRCHAVYACLIGDWGECQTYAEQSLSLLPSTADSFDVQVLLSGLAVTEAETGLVSPGKRHLQVVKSLHDGLAESFPYPLLRIARVTGDMSDLDRVESVARQIKLREAPFATWSMIRQEALALVAVLRGDAAEATRYLDYLRPLKGHFGPTPHYSKSIDALLGLLCVTTGALGEASTHFEDALAFCEQAGYRPELAWTRYDYAELLIQRAADGDLVNAGELLEESRVLAGELGMKPLVAKVLAAAARLQTASSVRRSRPAGLTQREVEVLRLVAHGYTNAEIGERLFISSQTVARHVHNLLVKTGMANRAEATGWAIHNNIAD